MKVEIDLNDILADEYGPTESLADSIHRQVVEHVAKKLDAGIKARIDTAVNELLNRAITESLVPRMDSILAEILDAEFTPVDRYGTKGQKTTFRNQLVESIRSECVVKRDNYNRRPENAFTKAVDSCVEDLTKALQQQFKQEVDTEFSQRAVQMAKETFAKCLGLK